ncbi:hypothetical protein NG799_07160 [Laspinema sp. D1]|uniref:Uncharacterized protein n=1 Tax=Laspinema palackyanum D2a TaxID=2953684 RepID=A0ABT2MN03_9CYAN|nr:hypothetical protein [Laspinema sp. D2a]
MSIVTPFLHPPTADPFLDGLYDGSSELGTEAEAILTAEVKSSLLDPN